MQRVWTEKPIRLSQSELQSNYFLLDKSISTTKRRTEMTSSYIKMQLKQIRATLDNAETDIELLQQENKRLLKQIAELTKEMESVNE
jgi:cell division septum initiation protein DivIVA